MAWQDRGVEWFIAVVVVAALGVAAIVAAGGLGSMPAEPTRDVFRQDLPIDCDLTGEDLRRLRFGVAVRGYAMSQVDDVLDRLSGEVAERDRRIADLEALLVEHGIEYQSDNASGDEGPAGNGSTDQVPPGTEPGGEPKVEYLR